MLPRRGFSAVALCAVLSLPCLAPAQTNALRATPANRYLLILESSRPMQKRTEGAIQVINDLFRSAMGGQLRPGDSVGLWTYNDELYAGRFPVQQWATNSQTFILRRVRDFLQEQKCEKSPRLDRVLPTMRRVIDGSEFITVILISSGAGEMRGTPFDEPINRSFKLWRDQQQQARMPFITILRARRGQITDYAVNPAPWEVQLPPLPQELLVARTQPKPPPPAPKPKPITVPPLIISGKKPAPLPAAKPSEAIPAPASLAPPTNEPVASAPTPGKLTLGQTDSAWPDNSPDQTPWGPEAAAGGPVASEPGAGPAPLQNQELVQKNPGAATATVVHQPVARPATLEAVAARTQEPGAKERADQTTPQGLGSRQLPRSLAPAAAPTSPQVAVAHPSPALFGTKTFLGLGLIVVALGGLIWSRHARSRQSGHVSLITRSLEREKP